MNTVRWGIIGAGDVCERKSGPSLYEVPGSQLVLVHRRNRAAGTQFCRRHRGRYVTTLEELVHSPDIDSIYVATPHELHAAHTVAALEAGKHVLVEKPMATRRSDCDRMVDAARHAGKSLGVAYYRRGYPSVKRVRELIAEGAVGQPTGMSINNEFPTSHRLDLVLYLLGQISAVRSRAGGSGGFRFEQMTGRIELIAGGGTDHEPVPVSMADTWTETGMPEALVIRGESGTIHLCDLKGGSLTVRSEGPGTAREELGGLRWTHWGLVENFVAHLQTGEPLLCDGAEGRRSTIILDALAEAPASTPEEWTPIEEH